MPHADLVVAGIDVHKSVLMVVAGSPGQTEPSGPRARFGTTRSCLRTLAAWLREHEVTTVVMESTAQYWWPVWLELEGQFALHLAQARSNAAPHGRKTDWGDATRLVRRYLAGDLRLSFVPDAEQRSWRRLSRTWKSLGEQIVEARHELEAVLEEGQIKLAGFEIGRAHV